MMCPIGTKGMMRLAGKSLPCIATFPREAAAAEDYPGGMRRLLVNEHKMQRSMGPQESKSASQANLHALVCPRWGPMPVGKAPYCLHTWQLAYEGER